MRINSAFLRSHCRHLIETQNLPLSLIAFDHFISLNQSEMRKDGITPSEHHEHSHLLNLYGVLEYVGWKLGYSQEKFGSADALVVALLFHDLIEDRGQSATVLLGVLYDGINQNLRDHRISAAQAEMMRHDARCAIAMVRDMSRNEPDEHGNILNRSQYNNRWLGNPGAVIIKLIDWTNKLATMPGVETFECKNQWRMRRNLEETDHVFLDERQAITRRAMKMHIGSAEIYEALDAIMCVTFNCAKGYTFYATSNVEANPADEPVFDFSKQIEKVNAVSRHIPRGANNIAILTDRIRDNPYEYPRVDDYYRFNIKPMMEAFTSIAPQQMPMSSPLLCARL